jgi:hypothetical protein
VHGADADESAPARGESQQLGEIGKSPMPQLFSERSA